MKYVFAVSFFIAILVPTWCAAVSPVMTVKGPQASLKMEVHNFGVHLFHLTLPERAPSYVPSPVKITLSRGLFPNRFEVDIAYKNLPDGRIDFRVDVPKEEESFYQIQVVEMKKGSTWYELFSSKLSEIPRVSNYGEGIATPSQ